MPETGRAAALDPERMEGQEISGCKIIEKIATGGMGTIYRALQVSMSRQVAIKCLAEDFSRDKQYVQRFVREARAAGELSHTNLIHVMDVGTYQGVYYYIMEFVDGQSMDRILRIKEKLGPETVVEVMLQSAKALSAAHARGIIHRDVKPDNLMITKDGTVKIADLGIAKKLDPTREATDAGLVLGTPNYMAPEQAQDASLTDTRSDIYALGSTAYHMLTGRPPYTGKNALEILTNVVKKKPVPIEQVRKGLPSGLVAIINKMMQRDPEKRYQSMDDLVKDLDLYKAGKFQDDKASRRDLDDDDDEENRPKVPLELAADPAEEARKSATKAPGVSDEVKLSGTRVYGPGGPQDLASAKAIGAIQEKAKSKVIPLITLIGGLVLMAIGWQVYTKVTAPRPKDGSHSKTTNVEELPPAEIQGEVDAKKALEEAVEFEHRATNPRADVIRAYREVADKWPDTPSGKKAKGEAEGRERDWVEAVDRRVAEGRKALEAIGEAGSFKAVEEAVRRARTEAAGRADLVEKARVLEKEMEEGARIRNEKLMTSARALAGQGEWLPAIEAAKKVLAMEVAKYTDPALKAISDWREKSRDDRDAAYLKYDKALSEAFVHARGAEDPKVEPNAAKALERIKAAVADEGLKPIRAQVEADVPVFAAAAEVVDEAFAQLDRLKGEMFRFSKDAYPNDKPVKVLGAQRPGALVEFQGRPLKTKPLTHEDIWNLAKMTLDQNVQGKIKLSSYLFARGDLVSARRLISSFPGTPEQALRARIEEQEIRQKQARKPPRELMDPRETVAWKLDTMTGAWNFKERNTELFASGDKAYRHLAAMPDSEYAFEAEVRKEVGPNGFAMLFNAWGTVYQWHVGDEGNTCSIVRGVPSTRTQDRLEQGDPVHVRVVVLEERAIGYLNGVRRWEITKSTAGSPELADAPGLAVFNTLVRFRKVRLYEFK
jgi:serine/threonine-protein kinase